MGKDDLPVFPTPKETFGMPSPMEIPYNGHYRDPNGPRSFPGEGFFDIPAPQKPRYGSGQYPQQPAPPPAQPQPHSYGYSPSPNTGYPRPQLQKVVGPSASAGYPSSRPSPHVQHRQPRPPSPRTQGARQTMPEASLRSMFNDVDRTGDGRLSESELASALVNGDYSKFNRETVRLMIKLFDRDGDQCINFEEFGQLWKYLHEWRKVFEMFDRDRSGSINLQEFRTALDAFGYSLSHRCIGFVFQKYSKPDRRGDFAMSFDMFVQSCIVLKSIADTFKRIDTDRDGYITIGFEEFLVEVTELR